MISGIQKSFQEQPSLHVAVWPGRLGAMQELPVLLQSIPGLSLRFLINSAAPDDAVGSSAPQILVLIIGSDQTHVIKRLRDKFPKLGLIVLPETRLSTDQRVHCLQLGADVVYEQLVTIPEVAAAIRSLHRRLAPMRVTPKRPWDLVPAVAQRPQVAGHAAH